LQAAASPRNIRRSPGAGARTFAEDGPSVHAEGDQHDRSKPIACAASVSGLDANWAPRTATGAGPANANVTLAQAERCDLITKRVPKPRPGDDQSSGWRRAYRHGADISIPDGSNWPAASVAGIRPARRLSRGKLPSPPMELLRANLTIADIRQSGGLSRCRTDTPPVVVELIAKSDVENTRQSCLSRFVRYQVRAWTRFHGCERRERFQSTLSSRIDSKTARFVWSVRDIASYRLLQRRRAIRLRPA
jgi:hypothetical protein